MLASNMNVIEFKSVSKCYSDIVALDNLDFNALQGEIFGLLRPNVSL